jgi:hypothetical protein
MVRIPNPTLTRCDLCRIKMPLQTFQYLR